MCVSPIPLRIVWRVLDTGYDVSLNGVWCAPDGETIAVGTSGFALHSDGAVGVLATWEARQSGTSFTLFSVAGDEQGNAYAVGYNGLVSHYANETWESWITGTHDRLNAISVAPGGDIYAAGEWGLILRYSD